MLEQNLGKTENHQHLPEGNRGSEEASLTADCSRSPDYTAEKEPDKIVEEPEMTVEELDAEGMTVEEKEPAAAERVAERVVVEDTVADQTLLPLDS